MPPETQDAIIDIAPNRIRYFGGPGQMLLPSPATVAALLARVPERQLITTDELRRKLAEQFAVQGCCPVTTQKALQAIAQDPHSQVAYWRVVNQNGGLISRFPGGVKGHAARLRQEGFRLDLTGPVPRVKHFKDKLVRF
jgi:hypothetical protein